MMKIKIKIKILFAIALLFCLAFVSAEEVYFNQCVRVLYSNGSEMTNLNCTFKDNIPIFNNLKMNHTTNGIYCLGINNSFPEGNYTFYAKCDDGNITRSVFGDFIVGAGEPEWNWLYIIALLIPILLIILSKKAEDPIFTFFAGIIFICFVPVMYIKGYPNFANDFIFNAFALILLGIGIYFMLKSGVDLIRGGRD